MKTSQKGIDLIKQFEGCRLSAYKCPANVWTIGYGHTYGVKEGQTISQKQADKFLKDDLKSFEAAVTNYVKVPLSQNQFDALVSFSFNVGSEALRTSTLLKLLNQGKYSEAAEQFDRWVYASGKKLAGLVRRRKAEKELFLDHLEAKQKYKVIASALNVRAGAGMDFKIVGLLKKDKIITLSEIKNNWGKLSDGSGWVFLKFLQEI